MFLNKYLKISLISLKSKIKNFSISTLSFEIVKIIFKNSLLNNLFEIFEIKLIN